MTATCSDFTSVWISAHPVKCKAAGLIHMATFDCRGFS